MPAHISLENVTKIFTSKPDFAERLAIRLGVPRPPRSTGRGWRFPACDAGGGARSCW